MPQKTTIDRLCEVADEIRDASETLTSLAQQLDRSWRDAAKVKPRTDTLVEVCGHSGMSKNTKFLCYALYMPEYRPLEPWRTVQQDALSDFGWTPLFWRLPEPLPDMPE